MTDFYTSDLSALTDAELEDFEERAAILQFDGGMSKADAEELALRLVKKEREQALHQMRRET